MQRAFRESTYVSGNAGECGAIGMSGNQPVLEGGNMIRVDEYSRLVYLGHKVSGDVLANVERAQQHLKRLQLENVPNGIHIIAPWMTEVLIHDDSDPDQRRQGLESCKYTIKRCDELWLVRHPGEDLSSGMLEEAEFAFRCGQIVKVLTYVPRAARYIRNVFPSLEALRSVYVPS